MLQVVVGNLVENAIRYAGPGVTLHGLVRRGAPTARRLRRLGRRIGGPEEDLPRLFERFYRADHARSSRGTGLGLAIVKHVVAAAGGTVEATATSGGGLTVTCSFPAGL